jgi:hypothetical protein
MAYSMWKGFLITYLPLWFLTKVEFKSQSLFQFGVEMYEFIFPDPVVILGSGRLDKEE